MATVPATEFKARCLELMDRVAEGRETYVITKRGRPVARLVPTDPPRSKSIFGCMTDQTEDVGELDRPPWTGKEWNEFERKRAEQWKAWEGEWRRHGTISGVRSVGQPPLRMRAGEGARSNRRRARR